MENREHEELEGGTLYLVPTPIGNLGDVTARSAAILRGADILACEDTRHTRILLQHLGIERPVLSYHEHNKKEVGPRLIAALKEGKSVAQVSDAGMPVISDPGADLVRLALDEGIPVVPLPGPNAALTALIASGLDVRQFVFIGFLPRTTANRRALLESIRSIPFTLIFYEAPHRLKDMMKMLLAALGDRQAVTARELTKRFETFRRAPLSVLLEELADEPPRGEYVVLVEGCREKRDEEDTEGSWQEAALELAQALPMKEAARQVSVKWKRSRREVYQFLLSAAEEAGE